jgi:hypothetical protein
MSRRNKIILTPDRAILVEGIINAGETPKPGTLYQIDPSQSMQQGRWVWKVYTRDADADRPKGPLIILIEDIGQGKTTADAYAAEDRAFGAIPLPGCELNVLYKNVSGTADDVALGDLLIPDTGTGKFIVTTGTVEIEPFMALEALTDPTADALIWVIATGY